MTKYTGTIKNFLQGVSQQAEFMRTPEQLSKLVNCRSSITKGVGKRPGTYYTGTLGNSIDIRGRTFYHYDRGDTLEAYLFSIGSASLKIYNLYTGTEETVSAPDGLAYFTAANPSEAFQFHTVADTTFVVNKEISPAMQNPSDSDTIWQRMIYCKQANFGRTYEVKIDDVVVSTYTTPSTVTVASGDVDKRLTLSTVDIIDALVPDIEAWATTEEVTFEQSGDVIYLTKATGTYKVRTNDGNNGNDLYSVSDEIGLYTDLPAIAKNGYKVKVIGLDDSANNDYYVQFKSDDDSSIGRGVWEESVGFGVMQDFAPDTMPMQIVREADGTFTVSNIEWKSRKSGDDNSNPVPSFVGRSISDILIYQGRLVLPSGENICASVTFDFFNFFAVSVLQVAADDPIDTASSDKQVTPLHHTLMFNSALVSFSNSSQFLHPGTTPFSSKDFSLVAKAKYPSSPSCSPVAAASSIFFPYSFGVYSGIRELQYDGVSGNLQVQASTDHVTRYIKGNVQQVEASTGYNMLFVRADGGVDYDNKIYIYEWYDRGDTRLQNAWSTWEFSRDVLYIALIRSSLYIVTDTGTQVLIEVIDLSDEASSGVPFPVRLDMLELVKGTPNYVDDVWEIPTTLLNWNTTVTIIAGAGTGKHGLEMVYEPGATPTIAGEFLLMLYEDNYVNRIYTDPGYVQTGSSEEEPYPYFWVGIPYTAEGIITNPYIRDGNGDIRDVEKLRLNFMEFNLNDTGSITLYCTRGNNTFEKKYNARIIDRIGLNPDDPPEITETKLRLGIRSERSQCDIGFKSDEYTPFYVINADWAGNHSSSGRRSR